MTITGVGTTGVGITGAGEATGATDLTGDILTGTIGTILIGIGVGLDFTDHHGVGTIGVGTIGAGTIGVGMTGVGITTMAEIMLTLEDEEAYILIAMKDFMEIATTEVVEIMKTTEISAQEDEDLAQ
jgi:hypothetical protein